MTKIIRKWHKMGFWQALLGIITPLTIGGEIAVYATGIHPVFHYVVLAAAVIAGIIKYTIKDEDGNGLVDGFEDKK